MERLEKFPKSFRGVAIDEGIDKIEARYISHLLFYVKNKSEKQKQKDINLTE